MRVRRDFLALWLEGCEAVGAGFGSFFPGVDCDAKCNPVDSIGSSTKSRVSHSERGPSARFQGTKTARREGRSSPFRDAGGCISPQNSGGSQTLGPAIGRGVDGAHELGPAPLSAHIDDVFRARAGDRSPPRAGRVPTTATGRPCSRTTISASPRKWGGGQSFALSFANGDLMIGRHLSPRRPADRWGSQMFTLVFFSVLVRPYWPPESVR